MAAISRRCSWTNFELGNLSIVCMRLMLVPIPKIPITLLEDFALPAFLCGVGGRGPIRQDGVRRPGGAQHLRARGRHTTRE